jgi:hypothetical protein
VDNFVKNTVLTHAKAAYLLSSMKLPLF